MNVSTIRFQQSPAPISVIQNRTPAVKTQTLEPQDGYKSSQDNDWVDAGKLMKERQIPAENHQLMQENIATYLAHRNNGIPSQRWQNKMERDLKAPYNDEAVYAQIEKLEDSMQANLRELPVYPSRVFITGSFAKGRLGANSDLDGFAVLPKEHMSAGFDSFENREKTDKTANLFPLSEDSPGYVRGHLMFSGQSIELTPQQLLEDGVLRKTYDKIKATRSTERRETSATFEWITGKVWGEEKTAKDKREAFDNQNLKTRIQNAIMSFGGTLSMTPLVGPVVNKVADIFATQKHLDFRTPDNQAA